MAIVVHRGVFFVGVGSENAGSNVAEEMGHHGIGKVSFAVK